METSPWEKKGNKPFNIFQISPQIVLWNQQSIENKKLLKTCKLSENWNWHQMLVLCIREVDVDGPFRLCPMQDFLQKAKLQVTWCTPTTQDCDSFLFSENDELVQFSSESVKTDGNERLEGEVKNARQHHVAAGRHSKNQPQMSAYEEPLCFILYYSISVSTKCN